MLEKDYKLYESIVLSVIKAVNNVLNESLNFPIGKICDHNDQELVREIDFNYHGYHFSIETYKCSDCGEYLYGYNGWQKPEWRSVADVKDYLKTKFANDYNNVDDD